MGKGNFGPQKVITTAAPGAMSVYVGDVDGDGNPDVLSASRVSLDDDPLRDYKIAWYENVSPEPGDANCDFQFDEQDVSAHTRASRETPAQGPGRAENRLVERRGRTGGPREHSRGRPRST